MNKLFLKIRELITKPYFKYVIITVAFIKKMIKIFKQWVRLFL